MAKRKGTAPTVDAEISRLVRGRQTLARRMLARVALPSEEACRGFDDYRRSLGQFVRTRAAEQYRRVVLGWEDAVHDALRPPFYNWLWQPRLGPGAAARHPWR